MVLLWFHSNSLINPFSAATLCPASKVFVTLGDSELEVKAGFRLYICSRLPNPKLSPEMSAKMTIVDCTVAHRGLEDQLLSRFILKEKQELEQQRRRLVSEVSV